MTDGDCDEEARREDDANRQNGEEDETLEARHMRRARSTSEPTQAEG